MQNHKAIVLYLFFGGCTTLVNILLYALCYEWMSWGNVPSTCLAWLGAAVFAFITNKLWVFESRDMAPGTLLKEWGAFLLCRVATGVVDVGIMYTAVDVLGLEAVVWKVVANGVVVVGNWVVSKEFVFCRGNGEKR